VPSAVRGWLPNYLLAALIWGTSFYFIEILLTAFHPTVVALLRLSIGAMVLLTMSYLMGLKLPVEIWRKLFFAGILMNSLPGFLFAFAQDYVSSILAGIINATTPLMTLLFILFVFREQQVTKSQIVGLVVGFLGVLIVLGVWTGLPSGQFIGVIAMVCATAGYGFSLPYYRKNIVPLNYPPTSLMALQVAISAVQILPFALFNLQLRSEITWQVGLAALLLGGLGSGLAYVMHYQVTKVAGAAIASSVTYVMPVVAAAAGVLLLNEILHWYEFAGAAVVMIGIIISQRQRRQGND
jgi:drug/metabolite transporter (DMT)-like permease